MAVKLTYIGKSAVPVEVDGVLPEVVRGITLPQIEKLPIQHGNRQVPLAELFRVAGDPGDGRIEFVGDLSGVHRIGAGMASGEIHVAGPAGRHAGTQMRGGTLSIAGDAGDWLGAELHGGVIEVRGRAGDLVGAAYRGSRRGMTGGTILVRGDAGSEAAVRMRRGLIAIGGSCGEALAFNMLAGTVLVWGDCGARPGAAMRRGTLGLFGRAPELLPSFRPGSDCRPVFLALLLRRLKQLNYSYDPAILSAPLRMHHGDLLAGGRGEVFVNC